MKFINIIALFISITSVHASSDEHFLPYEHLLYPPYAWSDNQPYENEGSNQSYENYNDLQINTPWDDNQIPYENKDNTYENFNDLQIPYENGYENQINELDPVEKKEMPWEFANNEKLQPLNCRHRIMARTKRKRVYNKKSSGIIAPRVRKAKDSIIYKIGKDLVDILENNYELLKPIIKNATECPLCPKIHPFDKRLATSIHHLGMHFPKNIKDLEKYNTKDSIPEVFRDITHVVMCCGRSFTTTRSSLYKHLERKTTLGIDRLPNREFVGHTIALIERRIDSDNKVTWNSIMQRTIILPIKKNVISLEKVDCHLIN